MDLDFDIKIDAIIYDNPVGYIEKGIIIPLDLRIGGNADVEEIVFHNTLFQKYWELTNTS